MRRSIFILCLLSLLLPIVPLRIPGYRLLYREQLYELYHQHFYQYPERIAENIYWLERALRADFANPLYALAVIEDETEWELYRNLFTLHINLKLIEQYLLWGSKYNKFNAFFYNYPWKRQNLESLEKAETLFRYALVYWDEALKLMPQIRESRFRYIYLEEIQNWHDEFARIDDGSLDYEQIINKHLRRLSDVRERFEQMDANSY